jgi:hypothetical protein
MTDLTRPILKTALRSYGRLSEEDSKRVIASFLALIAR